MQDEKRYTRRYKKFGDLPVSEMSGTTRKFFKRNNHRKQEIISYEQRLKRQKARERQAQQKEKETA